MPLPVHAPPAVDVEHHPLRSLEEDAIAAGDCVADKGMDVADHPLEPLRVAEVLVEDRPLVERRGVVQFGQHLVLEPEHEAQLLLEERRLLQVADAKADAPHLVLIGRAHPTGRRAQPVIAALHLAQPIELGVVRHDHVGTLADDQVGGADALGVEVVDLLEENLGVDHHPMPDDADGRGVEDAAGDEVEPVLLPLSDHRVAGVVATLRAHHHVDAIGEEVDDLALALVAPLPAHQDGDAHRGGKPTRGHAHDPEGQTRLSAAVHAAVTDAKTRHPDRVTP
jgi:hypothetical protein